MAKYLDSNGLSHFMGKIKAAFVTAVGYDSSTRKLQQTKNGSTTDIVTLATVATSGSYSDLANQPTIPSASSATPSMDGTASAGSSSDYARADHVHPTDTSRAASSHTHGNITSGGDITATAPTIASGDKLIINDESASKVTNGPSFGTSTTTYLRNDGTWGTPAGTTPGSGALTVKVNNKSSTGSFNANSSSAATLSVTVYADDIESSYYGDTVDGAIEALDTNKVDKVTGMGLSTNDYTDAERTKLAGIASGAEVNQNAFSNVVVGSTTLAADGKTDTLTITAGSNITLTPTASSDSFTIAATDTDTKNTAGSTNSTSKLFLVGATSQAANPQTYSHSSVYATAGALHATTYNGITIGTTSGDGLYLQNGTGGSLTCEDEYTLGDACEKAIDGSISSGSTSTNLPTSAAVVSYVATQMADVAGALVYKGTLGTGGTVTDLPASHTKGWYYVVATAGTYAGETCEAGDMVICHATGTTASDADWDVVQTNIETLTTSEIDALWTAA